MRLIKLTESHTNDEIYFNADKIESFSRLDDTTYLYMSTSSSAFEVVETPEEIMQLIKQAEEI